MPAMFAPLGVSSVNSTTTGQPQSQQFTWSMGLTVATDFMILDSYSLVVKPGT